MFEHFTDEARGVVVQAQAHALRLGDGYLGCEHLLLGVIAADRTTGAVLREHGLTLDGVERELRGRAGAGVLPGSGLFGDLDSAALATLGIDLDTVRARMEDRLGSESLTALTAPPPGGGRRRPVRLIRRRREGHRAPRKGSMGFTPDAQRALQHAVGETIVRQESYVHPGHLALGVLASGSVVPEIVARLGTSPGLLRTAIEDHLRRSS